MEFKNSKGLWLKKSAEGKSIVSGSGHFLRDRKFRRVDFISTKCIFSTFQHRLRSKSQHASVWMGPEEQARAGSRRINCEYKQNKEAERDLQVLKGKKMN